MVDVGSCREPFQERVAYWAERFHGVYRVDRQMETEDTGSDLSKSLLLTLHTQLDSGLLRTVDVRTVCMYIFPYYACTQ